MAIGVITGSGTYALPGYEGAGRRRSETRMGGALLARGTGAGREASTSRATTRGTGGSATRSRIAPTSPRWPQHGVDAVLAVTVCGAVDPAVELGSLIGFDDLHFPVNRLPDGSLCRSTPSPATRGAGTGSSRTRTRRAARGPWSGGARGAGQPDRAGGCYGHVDGPRFDTKAEIRGLAAAG